MRGRNSRTVTSAPSRFQTEPTSSPIAPAPITTSFLGASVNSSASVLLTIVLPSNFANGRSTGALPVAITMFFASISCVWPLEDLIETFPGAVIVPKPSMTVTLFVFISDRTPVLNVFTTLSLRSCIFARSARAPSTTMPCLAASFLTNIKWSVDVRSALLGMQPTLRQVPPISWSFSTRAVFNPSLPARIAAMYPPWPEPMIRTSNFSITTVAQASALAPQSCASWEARATLKIQRKFCRVLDALFHFDEECNRFFSVDCAVIVAEREIHHWADFDFSVHRHGTRHDFMHPKNAALRRI